ncbi:hypothetical protein ACFX12_016985 [Malus domestica]
MVLLHLPRTHISLYTHFSLFAKPKTPTFATATTLPAVLTSALFSAPRSSLSASEPIPISQIPRNSKPASKSRSRSSSCRLKLRFRIPTPVL